MKTPITKERIQNHITYSWWKYLIVAVLSIMGWSIIFSVTAYRPPEEKKIVLGLYTVGVEDNLHAYMADAKANDFSDMEEVQAMYILPDTTYGDMILSTRIAARECDLYVLPREQFVNYAAQAGFMPLDLVLPDLVAELEAEGISLSRGWRAIDDEDPATEDVKHLYGIPCANLPSASLLFGTDTSDVYLSLFFETGNDENCIRFFEQLVHDLMQEPPAEEVPAA